MRPSECLRMLQDPLVYVARLAALERHPVREPQVVFGQIPIRSKIRNPVTEVGKSPAVRDDPAWLQTKRLRAHPRTTIRTAASRSPG